MRLERQYSYLIASLQSFYFNSYSRQYINLDSLYQSALKHVKLPSQAIPKDEIYDINISRDSRSEKAGMNSVQLAVAHVVEIQAIPPFFWGIS